MGFEPTPNFQRSGLESFEHCYYTEPLRLPDDYSGLWFKKGRDGACPVDERKYDVFYYAPEALAGSAAAVTPALDAASPARRAFVVAHEDFHDQPGIRALPPQVKEAAATLAGFLVEREQSRPAGARPNAPAPAAVAFLEKSRLINRSHDSLSRLYEAWRAGEVSRRQALSRKREALEELADECGRAEVNEAFSACPAAFNNAGLAFEATYTRMYPRLFAIYEATGWKTRETLGALENDLPALEGVKTTPEEAIEGLIKRLRPRESERQAPPKRPK